MNPPRVLILDDEPLDAELMQRALRVELPDATVEFAHSRADYEHCLSAGNLDAILSDSTVPGCEGLKAFGLARERQPSVPFIFVSKRDQPGTDVLGLKGLGIAEVLSKSDLSNLGKAVRAAMAARATAQHPGYERLIAVVKELSLARDLPAIMVIVRRAARQLTGADGATFVLRDGDLCHYADEDAIGPLWKGQRFPAENCISGWAMMNGQPAVVEDIYHDPRIPVSAYEPTFVRSVVMVPIRSSDPIGAVGTYWAHQRLPEANEVALLQSLADTTAVAMENVRVYAELESRVRERTAELESFAYAVSHDLRAPLRHMQGYAAILEEDHATELGAEGRKAVSRITVAAKRMSQMVDGLLELSRAMRAPVHLEDVNLATLAREVVDELSRDRPILFVAPDNLPAKGDPVLLRIVLQNLLGNAWKFTAKTASPRVELGVHRQPGMPDTYFVQDNGAGFDEAYADKLFEVFQRLHSADEFPGTGVGLATVHRIVAKHGGRIWGNARPDEGATFHFTLAPASR
ncbi:MAG: ATP-binding protein [Dongiaceae bacterium]